jgi:hypothetical protein
MYVTAALKNTGGTERIDNHRRLVLSRRSNPRFKKSAVGFCGVAVAAMTDLRHPLSTLERLDEYFPVVLGATFKT